ncbi:MotA/TolQ/ExbB proton channel family protein [Cesiribacter sp. SM1]|uniref:MotA/TolQ/ExbB proton channel family protein n=1 Tax=Cesiribacter sp. SM1 TaxID=2861196 RepID=UPI001CD5072B|nr:MotA/TolQ/ExbB proton channel family protein [Cesiribacter sp. SM1]
MFNLFIEGGWEFMSLITIMALVMFYFAARGISQVYGKSAAYNPATLYYIRFFGMLALVIGVFGQLLGLYEAMKYISQMEGGISQQMLAGGIKVSSITTLYGVIIFLIAHLIWFVLDLKARRSNTGTIS